jgi:hypothetical protein
LDDGIILPAAVRLSGRPVVIYTPDTGEQTIDIADESFAPQMRLGLINRNNLTA